MRGGKEKGKQEKMNDENEENVRRKCVVKKKRKQKNKR